MKKFLSIFLLVPTLFFGYEFPSKILKNWSNDQKIVLHDGVFRKSDWRVWNIENNGCSFYCIKYVPKYESDHNFSKCLELRSYLTTDKNGLNKQEVSSLIPFFVEKVLASPLENDYTTEVLDKKHDGIFFKWSLKKKHAGLDKQCGYSRAFFYKNQICILSYINLKSYDSYYYKLDAKDSFFNDVCVHSDDKNGCQKACFSANDFCGDPVKLPAALGYFKQNYQSIFPKLQYNMILNESLPVDQATSSKLIIFNKPLKSLGIGYSRDYLDIAKVDMKRYTDVPFDYRITYSYSGDTYAYATGKNSDGNYYFSLVRLSYDYFTLKGCHLMRKSPEPFDQLDVDYFKDKLGKIKFSKP